MKDQLTSTNSLVMSMKSQVRFKHVQTLLVGTCHLSSSAWLKTWCLGAPNHDSSLGGTQPIREGTHHPDEAIFASHFHLAKRHKVWPHQQNLGTRASGWAQKTWMVHKETFN